MIELATIRTLFWRGLAVYYRLYRYDPGEWATGWANRLKLL